LGLKETSRIESNKSFGILVEAWGLGDCKNYRNFTLQQAIGGLPGNPKLPKIGNLKTGNSPLLNIDFTEPESR
jgi:hypothetical protein